ncbi:1,4-dihydroxy-2-naphthoate octaprenyltransferase [Lentibacillus cibarius]|uniref:1,4-dihydroxy-2-naphthoate octaprenyltransferase n=1 Tax=Lentibacillus cibarius TaxID=2583219 RepID=A0A549YMK8_9BACI|nr:1,4-dihydroxy-2-naphthoate octaprenyltransferase [Lentibacillus cibarius]TRM13104.1 1,4-dihydroxy-2-naphthoate octaprenyltransferase [Lentibacillus cibarius]
MLSSAINRKQEIYYYRASWLQLFRPMTLTGTITPILVGTGIAAMHESIRFSVFLAMLIASLLIQSATNLFNDYYDFQHGQDKAKWTTDQSSASGPPHAAVLYTAILMISAAVLIGAWLAYQSSIWIIPVGIASIIFGYLYSAGPRPLCSIGLGETVAFTFLGPIVTILSYVVQGNELRLDILAISLPFALIIASMILTNNIRDIEKDHAFRHTLATTLGRFRAVNLLTVLLTLSYITVIGLVVSNVVPWSATLVLLALPLAFRLRWSFRKKAKRAEELAGMKWAAWHHWAFGLLFAIGVWL